MTKDIYAEYALLDQQIKDLEAKKSEMRGTILEYLLSTDTKTIEHALGKFTVKKNPKVWTYPKKIVTMAEELKLAQVEAQEKGKATFTQGEAMQFTPVKI